MVFYTRQLVFYTRQLVFYTRQLVFYTQRYNEMAQKSILSFFGGGAKNKTNNIELKKPEKKLSTKKKGDIAAVEKDG